MTRVDDGGGARRAAYCGLLRLSVGIENVEDLAADLAAALQRVQRTRVAVALA
jgi:cystathionine beta-lyase/cystathionine gamma-synthase